VPTIVLIAFSGGRLVPETQLLCYLPCICRFQEASVENDGTFRDAARDAVFDKGTSRRIWGELYKVLDSSDVVIQVRRMY
jgi:hypothetical protein